ncbi:MAG: GerMN domain-containing protein [Christensenellaceae bacterium]|nr:GerMN domain-containing protein [Christensenellaceae bacterium]
MNKRVMAVLLIIMILCLLAGCTGVEKIKIDPVEINPESAAAKTEKMTVALYFGDAHMDHLVSESRSIDAAANDPLAISVLEELFRGPQNMSGDYNQLINPETKVLKVNNSSNILTVTLSKELLDWPAGITEASQRELAVYSIVNTLVEATGYSQIQLMVDRDDNGISQRLHAGELGFSSDAVDIMSGMLGILERNGAVVLTPENTVECIFDAMMKKDYSLVYSFIAYSDTYGITKTDEASFRSAVEKAAPTLEGYTVREVIVSDDGQSAVAMIDYTMRFATEDSTTRTNIPNYLVRENGIWKQRYSAFEDIFLTMEVSTS